MFPQFLVFCKYMFGGSFSFSLTKCFMNTNLTLWTKLKTIKCYFQFQRFHFLKIRKFILSPSLFLQSIEQHYCGNHLLGPRPSSPTATVDPKFRLVYPFHYVMSAPTPPTNAGETQNSETKKRKERDKCFFFFFLRRVGADTVHQARIWEGRRKEKGKERWGIKKKKPRGRKKKREERRGR